MLAQELLTEPENGGLRYKVNGRIPSIELRLSYGRVALLCGDQLAGMKRCNTAIYRGMPTTMLKGKVSPSDEVM